MGGGQEGRGQDGPEGQARHVGWFSIETREDIAIIADSGLITEGAWAGPL